MSQGSVDGFSWTTLRDHVDDQALQGKGATASWRLDGPDFYAYFRLVQTGPNSNGHLYLACSGLELYGEVQLGEWAGLAAAARTGLAAHMAQRQVEHLLRRIEPLAFVTGEPSRAEGV